MPLSEERLEEILRAPGAEKALDKLLCEDTLIDFVRVFWPFVEPSQPLVEGWPLESICEHLAAVDSGEIRRIIFSVPPGFMKSLLTSVFYPAWQWGPRHKPQERYICAAYSQELTKRDNRRFKQIIQSDLFQEFWGKSFAVDQESIERVANTKTGWKIATSVGGVTTGERGTQVIVDDPNSVRDTESEIVRSTTNLWWTEVMPTRIQDPKKGIFMLIQQRTHEDDVTGTTVAREMGFEHFMVPMRFDSSRMYRTSIGWSDPRGTVDRDPYSRMLLEDTADQAVEAKELAEREGEVAWPERFPEYIVERDEKTLGPYAVASQFQQSPTPRGGGIIKREWWQSWPPADWPDTEIAKLRFPPMEYVVASLDTAYTEKKENDFSALTVWGIWRWTPSGNSIRITRDATGDPILGDDRHPKIMLLHAWAKRLAIHGPPEPEGLRLATKYCDRCQALPGTEHDARCSELTKVRQDNWGLVEWTVKSCREYKVSTLLIEAKASGISVAQELARLYGAEDWGVQLVNPKGDKVARVYAIQHLFSNGQVYAPLDRAWCQAMLDEVTAFPRGRHDDRVDAMSLALSHLRETGLALRSDEADRQWNEELQLPRRSRALYDV